MRLLADENFPLKAVTALREHGHDVVWVKENSPSVEDEEVLAQAVRESRVLLTLDKDFGELAIGSGLPAHCGVVLFRVSPIPGRIADLAVRVVQREGDLRGVFLVVEPGRVRERPL